METLKSIPSQYYHRFLGLAIIAIAIASFTNSYSIVSHKNSYTLSANFESAEGLGENSPVTLAGIPIGKITNIKLNDDYTATVIMTIKNDILLPQDSSVSIVSNGIFGSRTLRITAGGLPFELQNGDAFLYSSKPIDFLPFLQNLITNAERNL